MDTAPKLGPRASDDNPVPVDIWHKELDSNGQPTGRAIQTDYRTLGEILKDLEAFLKERYEDPNLDYFQLAGLEHRLTSKWPSEYGHIACFVATGTSEGHYIHVELVNSKRIPLFIAKTFGGFDHAWAIAIAIAEALGA